MKLDKYHWLLIGMVLGFLVFVVVDLLLNKIINDSYNSYNFELEYLDLNETEIRSIENAIWDLESHYVNFTKLADKIIIFKDPKLLNDDKLLLSFSGNLVGLNINRGEKIYLKYSGDLCQLRRILCHELTHSLIDNIIVNEEPFVDRMAERSICYANTNCEQDGDSTSINSGKYIQCLDGKEMGINQVKI